MDEGRQVAPSVRTAIVGAGAIGGLFAAALVRAGHRVSILARGRTLAAIKDNGIRILVDGATAETVPVDASDNPAMLGEQDYVVLALKAQALPDLAASLETMVAGSWQ